MIQELKKKKDASLHPSFPSPSKEVRSENTVVSLPSSALPFPHPHEVKIFSRFCPPLLPLTSISLPAEVSLLPHSVLAICPLFGVLSHVPSLRWALSPLLCYLTFLSLSRAGSILTRWGILSFCLLSKWSISESPSDHRTVFKLAGLQVGILVPVWVSFLLVTSVSGSVRFLTDSPGRTSLLLITLWVWRESWTGGWGERVPARWEQDGHVPQKTMAIEQVTKIICYAILQSENSQCRVWNIRWGNHTSLLPTGHLERGYWDPQRHVDLIKTF